MSYPHKNEVSDEEKLDRIHALEGDLSRVVDAAGVVCDLLEGLMAALPPRASGEPPPRDFDAEKVGRAYYAAEESWNKASKLKDDLLAGLGYTS